MLSAVHEQNPILSSLQPRGVQPALTSPTDTSFSLTDTTPSPPPITEQLVPQPLGADFVTDNQMPVDVQPTRLRQPPTSRPRTVHTAREYTTLFKPTIGVDTEMSQVYGPYTAKTITHGKVVNQKMNMPMVVTPRLTYADEVPDSQTATIVKQNVDKALLHKSANAVSEALALLPKAFPLPMQISPKTPTLQVPDLSNAVSPTELHGAYTPSRARKLGREKEPAERPVKKARFKSPLPSEPGPSQPLRPRPPPIQTSGLPAVVVPELSPGSGKWKVVNPKTGKKVVVGSAAYKKLVGERVIAPITPPTPSPKKTKSGRRR
jgi:hypothetical protein